MIYHAVPGSQESEALKRIYYSSPGWVVSPLCCQVLKEADERAFPFLELVPQEYPGLTHINKGTASQCLSVGEMGI